MLHSVGGAAPWYSSDYGINWTQATALAGRTELVHFDIYRTSGTRVWGTWDSDDTSPVAYSDDWGATWTQSSANIIPNSGIGSRPLRDIAVSPVDSNKVVAMGRTNLNQVGYMYTLDGGSNWASIRTTTSANSMLPSNADACRWLSDNSIISVSLTTGGVNVHRTTDPSIASTTVHIGSAADMREIVEAANGVVFVLLDAIDTGAPLKRSTDYGVNFADVTMPSGWSSISADDGAMDYDSANDRLYVSKGSGASNKVWYLNPTASGSSWTDATFDYSGLITTGAEWRGLIVTLDEGSEEPPEPGDDRGGWRYVVPPRRRIPWTAAPHAVVAGPSRRMPMR